MLFRFIWWAGFWVEDEFCTQTKRVGFIEASRGFDDAGHAEVRVFGRLVWSKDW